jgi:diacylglycerol kinase family enzyme
VRRYFRLRMGLHMKEADALQRVTPFLFVGNNRYRVAEPEIETRSRPDSGRLWVCTAPSLKRRNFARVALRALVGREPDEELNVLESEELWVDPATPRAYVSFDGEAAVMDGPLHFRIRPRALRLVAPERPVVDRRFPPGS